MLYAAIHRSCEWPRLFLRHSYLKYRSGVPGATVTDKEGDVTRRAHLGQRDIREEEHLQSRVTTRRPPGDSGCDAHRRDGDDQPTCKLDFIVDTQMQLDVACQSCLPGLPAGCAGCGCGCVLPCCRAQSPIAAVATQASPAALVDTARRGPQAQPL